MVIVNSYLHEQTDDFKAGGLALTGLITLLLKEMASAAVFPPAILQIYVSFLCVCSVIDHEFRQNFVKVAVDPRGDS